MLSNFEGASNNVLCFLQRQEEDDIYLDKQTILDDCRGYVEKKIEKHQVDYNVNYEKTLQAYIQNWAQTEFYLFPEVVSHQSTSGTSPTIAKPAFQTIN